MESKYSFLSYNEWTNNDIHKGYSIDIEGLTYEDILNAIEREKVLKKADIKLNKDNKIDIDETDKFFDKMVEKQIILNGKM